VLATVIPQMQALVGNILDRCITDAEDCERKNVGMGAALCNQSAAHTA
jgi:hypothetical protein